jgi:hypothetical protein
MQWNPAKSKAVMFSCRSGRLPTSKLKLGIVELEWVLSATYLGVPFFAGRPEAVPLQAAALASRVEKAKASWNGSAVLSGPEAGLPSAAGAAIFQRQTLPQLLYGAPLLPDAALMPKALEEAEKVQKHAARTILGAFRTTRTWMTYAALGWMRISTRVQLDTIRLAIRCLAGVAAPIYARVVVAMVEEKLPWGLRLLNTLEKFGLQAQWEGLVESRDESGVCPMPQARELKKLAKVKAAELEQAWWRSEARPEDSLLLVQLDPLQPTSLRPMPIFSQRVLHSHYAFKFFLPSFIARDRSAKEGGVSPCPLCNKEPDTGDHLLLRCTGQGDQQRQLFSALRADILGTGLAPGLRDCLRKLAGEDGGIDVEVADKISSCLRILYRQRTMYYRAVRKADVRQRSLLPTSDALEPYTARGAL